MDVVALLMRWTHITAMAFIVGGALYARFVVAPVVAAERPEVSDRITAALRPLMLAAIVALVCSGLFNFFNKKVIPPGYHMVFGIKVLLALHVIAVAILLGRPGVAAIKRSRWNYGIVVSGLAVLLLSAYLRSLS